jgi:hypothetical protein
MKFLMTGTWDPADPEIPSHLAMEQAQQRPSAQKGSWSNCCCEQTAPAAT